MMHRHFIVVCLLAVCGCTARDIDTTYGHRRGIPGESSVNGTAVLSSMFEQAGHRVTTVRRISPRLNQFEVIVWAPDDFQPPSLQQRIALENWLEQGGRTLVYIGRDFDASISYWQKIRPHSGLEEQPELFGRAAEAQAKHDAQRVAAPAEEFARWYTMRRDKAPRKAKQLQSNAGWTKDIDVSKTDITLETRFDPPVQGDTRLIAPGSTSTTYSPSNQSSSVFMDPTEVSQQEAVPTTVEVLLASEPDAIVTRLSDASWSSSQIIVVTNGSFLLNMPLVNHEHRKLAGKLIDTCGKPGSVAFLETTGWDRIVRTTDPNDDPSNGLEAFTVWPLGFISMHAMLVGIVLCFVLFPIFGRPHELPPEPLGDFGRHIDALGRLLAQTRDEGYALTQLQNYRRQ